MRGPRPATNRAVRQEVLGPRSLLEPRPPRATLPTTPALAMEADPGLTRPAIGAAETGTPADSRSRPGNVDAALLALLAGGLVARIIIAYALSGSGFQADLISFQYWAANLASEGLGGFY